MRGAVAPAAVGVDIGCGMAAVEDQPDVEGSARRSAARCGSRSRTRSRSAGCRTTRPRGQHAPEALRDDGPGADGRLRASSTRRVHTGTVACQIGTLGGGNHFIEVCLDTDDTVWLMLHSGSRATSARCWPSTTSRSRAASSTTRRSRIATWRCSWRGRRCSTPTAAISSGRRSTPASTAQMMLHLLRGRDAHVLAARHASREPISCHHNYVAEEVHFGDELLVTRKGAIRAGARRAGHHPRARWARSRTSCAGSATRHSFQSASHGAGRRMSRTQARKRFTLRDLQGPDRRRRVPQGLGRHRRDAQGLQEHRPRDGAAAGPGRDRRRAETDRLREG